LVADDIRGRIENKRWGPLGSPPIYLCYFFGIAGGGGGAGTAFFSVDPPVGSDAGFFGTAGGSGGAGGFCFSGGVPDG
jgi:hypothetical protein